MGDECGYPAAIQKFRILISKALPPAFNLRRTRFQPLECPLSPFMEKSKEEQDSIQTHPSNDFPDPWDQSLNDSVKPFEKLTRKSPKKFNF